MTAKQYLAWLAAALTAVAAAPTGQAFAQAAPPVFDVDFNDEAYPVVITPTRLRQSIADVPASITVITAETLRRYGITRVEEALRLVPGMQVARAEGDLYQINYHGTRNVAARRLNVLVDGVSAYMSAYSMTVWPVLPVAIDDIDRIEVIRGPDSASYGPNSMMAVVNILTRHPKDVEPVTVSVSGDTRRNTETTVRLAGTVGDTSLRVTARAVRDEGYDIARERNMTTQKLVERPAHDGMQLDQLTVRGEHRLADGSTLQFETAYLGGRLEHDLLGSPNQLTFPDMIHSAGMLNARWTKTVSDRQELQINASHTREDVQNEWRNCGPQVLFWPESATLYRMDPALTIRIVQNLLNGSTDLPQDATPSPAYINQIVKIYAKALRMGGLDKAAALTCGLTNQNGIESRSQIELQDVYVVSDALRLVGGGGWRGQRATSQTFFDGSVNNEVSWLFGHVEYRPWDWLTLNVGGYGERNTLSGDSFAPRGAVNVRLSEHQTLRVVVSKGTRTPDLFEEKSNWRFTYTNLSVPVDGSTTATLASQGLGASDLRSEQNWSRELGYMVQWPKAGLSMDVRLFDERLSNLISSMLTATDFQPTSTGSVRLTGWETQTQWDISPRWSTWVNFAYLLNRQARPIDETGQYSKYSGAIGASVLLTDRWRASLAYYGASGDGHLESGYGRADLTVLHDFMWDTRRCSASFTLSQLASPAVTTFNGENFARSALYEDRLSALLRLRVAF